MTKGGFLSIFPVEFWDKNCTIDWARQVMIICEKKFKKVCLPFYWFSFRVIVQYYENWKNTFPKANFNDIWRKAVDHQ